MASNKHCTLAWVRPLDKVPFPNVWLEFEARESKNSDKLIKYRIQDLPEDRFDDAIQHMKDYYLADEPLSKSIGTNELKLLRPTKPANRTDVFFPHCRWTPQWRLSRWLPTNVAPGHGTENFVGLLSRRLRWSGWPQCDAFQHEKRHIHAEHWSGEQNQKFPRYFQDFRDLLRKFLAIRQI